MGEYEPDDSRDVTLSDNRAPGEPPRTGPRENEARRKASARDTNTAKRIDEPKQRARQSQSQSQSPGRFQSQFRSQSQFQAQAQSPESAIERPSQRTVPARDPAPAIIEPPVRVWPEAISVPAGGRRQAFAGETNAGDATIVRSRPDHPHNMLRPSAEHERKVRQQAGMQDDGDRGLGYGADGDGDGDGRAEMADAPDASECPIKAAGDTVGLRPRGPGSLGPQADEYARH